MNKKIITIAEIVFALVFVVLLAVFMATINSKGNTANTQLVDTLDMTDNSSLKRYESIGSTPVKGSDVKNAVENYKTLGGDAKITVHVKTLQDRTGTNYGYKAGSSEEHSKYIATSTSDQYINPSANFYVTVVKNNNDVVVGLAFDQAKKSGGTVGADAPLDNATALSAIGY